MAFSWSFASDYTCRNLGDARDVAQALAELQDDADRLLAQAEQSNVLR